MTNSVFAVRLSGFRPRRHRPLRQQMILRIYGGSWMFNRPWELRLAQQLAHLRVAPRWIGTFANGHVEEYISSDTLTSRSMRKPPVYVGIAKAMAHLHKILPQLEDFDGEEDQLAARFVRWREKAFGPCWEAFIQDISAERREWIESEGIRKNSEIDWPVSPLVLIHADLQHGNILQRKPKEKLQFQSSADSLILTDIEDFEEDDGTEDSGSSIALVDFDYACVGPRAFDLANHWCEWMYDFGPNNPTPYIPHPERFPDRQDQLEFCRAYLMACGGEDDDEKVTPEDLAKEALAYVPMALLMWALWGVCQAVKGPNESFDYASYAYYRFKLLRSNFPHQ